MHTDKQEEILQQFRRRYWPREFSKKPRKFNRQDENTPYIEWVNLSSQDSEEDEKRGDDEEEDEDDGIAGEGEGGGNGAIGMNDKHGNPQKDKDGQANEVLSTTTLLMRGMIGDEDLLEYCDQAEEVIGFSEQPKIPEFQKCVALLDDRSTGGNTLDKKGDSRPYFGPLTPPQLRDELSKRRFRIDHDKDDAANVFDDNGIDAERRLVFVTDLNPLSLEAIAATAPRSHAAALKNLFYRYITGKTSIAVTIPSHGFQVFTLDFNFRYFVLEKSLSSFKDPREKSNGMPLRQARDLPFLSDDIIGSASPNGHYRLYEAQMSVAVTGLDNWVWTAYGLVDSYFGSKESVFRYDEQNGPLARPDPLAAGQIPVNSLIWTPREYFFKIFEIRINQVRREWRKIFAKMESEIKLSRTKHVFPLLSNDAKARQEVRDSSVWSSQMVGLLRLLNSSLSETVDAWEEFCRSDIGYFFYDESSPTKSAMLQSSIGEVDKAFSDLRLLRRKLIDLKTELCENNPQGLTRILDSMFYPLILATGMFSTQGALPFTPNPARFAYSFIVFAVLVVVALIILYNWTSWFEKTVLHYKKQGVVKRAKEVNESGVRSTDMWSNLLGGRLRTTDLERGPEV